MSPIKTLEADRNGHCNCLHGLECPQCGFADYLYIEVRMVLAVLDEGTEGFNDTHYYPDSFCACPKCDYEGTVANFCFDRPAPRRTCHDHP